MILSSILNAPCSLLCFLLCSSTLVVSGEGFGIVVRTGDNTFIGQIAGLTGGEGDNKLSKGFELLILSFTLNVGISRATSSGVL